MHSLDKLWKFLENLEIVSLTQKKEQKTIWCQNQVIKNYYKVFHRISTSNRNEKSADTYE